MATQPADILARGTTVKGTVSGAQPLAVEGTVEGAIHLDNALTVAAAGVVSAELHVRTLTVLGEVRGNVFASELVLVKAGGRVIGDVTAPRIAIEDRAFVSGNLLMDVEEPAAQ